MSGFQALVDSAGQGEQLIAGKYRIERPLGEGGMGMVYAAQHVDLEKRVAIKIMREELTSQGDLVERMLEEARTVARLRSEHVAHVIDVGRLESGAPFIVMEYLDGCDLNTKLSQHGQLPVELTVGYLMQACEAVAEAHAAGIVHRDLKPENLFLTARTDGEPIIKVLDFGISRSMRGGEKPADSLIAGSPDYMSPESMRADTRIEASSDIWSMGAVLYELLTGQRPFGAATVGEICARVLNSEPTAPHTLQPNLPAGLVRVVLRCLRKDPQERFASVVDLAAALVPFGPEGSLEQAQRVARVAAGGRWKLQSAAPRVPRLASYTDVPNSTAAVVADRVEVLAETRELVRRRPRWHGVLVMGGAAAAALVLFVSTQRTAFSALPAQAQVAAFGVPPVTEPAAKATATESAAARAPLTSAPSSSAASPPPPAWKSWRPQASARVPEAKPSASFSYEAPLPKPETSASAADSAAAEAPPTPAPPSPPSPPSPPKAPESAAVDESWHPEGL